MPQLKITKANLSGITLPGSGQVDYHDTELKGFGVRATKEALTFFVRATMRGTGKKPFIPIGRYGTFTPDQARSTAKEYLQRLDKGENPHPKAQIQRQIITVKDLYSQYLSARKTPVAKSTAYQYEAWINNHFKDWLTLPADTITGTMVIERLGRIEKRSGSVQGANAIKLLKGLFRFGIALYPGVITFNPVDAVKEIRGRGWTKKTRRKTYITPEDFPAWYKAVDEYDNPKGRDFILLLLYTGLRRGEASVLKWSDLDLQNKTFTFTPEKKRGEKPEDDQVTMPMSKQLHQLLVKRLAAGWESEFIFPGRGMNPHITNPDPWKRDIIQASGVNFCFHDLRRTFITVAESLDISHYALKALLNHSLGNDVTGGYIMMTPERLREPTQKVVNKIMELAEVGIGISRENVT
ncbi:integrase [Geomonas limicola]|uniref:Integrase n=2 Tax=Geomonas TaxID=2651583 RepID=A0A6V8MR64_9BACT|nr:MULTISPECIES: integrase family protein [Geomonas]GFO62019.1 integrase [Geomonas silvestris]GFO70594.1 integrase [Geomonas limicola]